MLFLAVALLLVQAADPPKPVVRSIEVEPGVQLEVLDWGGSGRPLVLLAGLGDTAHVYHRFAPKLAGPHRVYGITRRGFGNSSRPRTGYSADRLADDVLRVIDTLQLERPVLIGHSVAGEELTSLAGRYPQRAAGLVYLDAAWDRTYVAPKKEPPPGEKGDFAKVGIPEQPPHDPARFDPAALVRAGVVKPDYARIRVPALALYAAPRTWQELVPGAVFSDPEKRAAAERVVAAMAETRKHMAGEFSAGVAQGRVVEIPGSSHYLFRTNEEDVLREVLAFLESLSSR